MASAQRDIAESYIIPDDENKEVLRQLGPVVELKTFKTNACIEDETSAKYRLVNNNNLLYNKTVQVGPSGKLPRLSSKLGDEAAETGEISLPVVCVGETINWSKGMFIKDYLQLKTTSLIGLDCSVKCVVWKNKLTGRLYRLRLQIYPGYRENCQGAMIFWGPRIYSSLENAINWKKKIADKIPVVLMTDNVTGMEWIGPRALMESRNAMNDFCRNNGFVEWFEILSRDFVNGEESVFGQAVSRLVEEIMKTTINQLN